MRTELHREVRAWPGCTRSDWYWSLGCALGLVPLLETLPPTKLIGMFALSVAIGVVGFRLLGIAILWGTDGN